MQAVESYRWIRALLIVTGTLCAALIAAPSLASFHTWRIAELYSSADGTVQFIELHESFGADSQDHFAGQALTSTQGATSRTYSFPTNLPSSTTANKSLLIATSAFAALGVVTPDYIVPAPFLFPTGGTLNFAGVDSVTYPSLPTDGVHSVDRTGAIGINSPTNFAGATGSIAAPPPPPPVAASVVPVLGLPALILMATSLLVTGSIIARRARRRERGKA